MQRRIVTKTKSLDEVFESFRRFGHDENVDVARAQIRRDRTSFEHGGDGAIGKTADIDDLAPRGERDAADVEARNLRIVRHRGEEGAGSELRSRRVRDGMTTPMATRTGTNG